MLLGSGDGNLARGQGLGCAVPTRQHGEQWLWWDVGCEGHQWWGMPSLVGGGTLVTSLESGVSDSAVGVPLWKTCFFPKIITVEGVNRVTDVNLLSPMQV